MEVLVAGPSGGKVGEGSNGLTGEGNVLYKTWVFYLFFFWVGLVVVNWVWEGYWVDWVWIGWDLVLG